VWRPDNLQECACDNGDVTCRIVGSGCYDRHGNPLEYYISWLLKDNQTVCWCSRYRSMSGSGTCKTQLTPVCLDVRYKVHPYGSSWFFNDCTKCTCNDGKIVCTQHDILASYGRFAVDKKTCYQNEEPACMAQRQPSMEKNCEGMRLA
jgi:hypothetical protein